VVVDETGSWKQQQHTTRVDLLRLLTLSFAQKGSGAQLPVPPRSNQLQRRTKGRDVARRSWKPRLHTLAAR
jgi:hypothetical protein